MIPKLIITVIIGLMIVLLESILVLNLSNIQLLIGFSKM